jgi:hypothetical protein
MDKKRRLMQAEHLINDEVFNAALKALEKNYYDMLMAADFKDQYKRDYAYIGLKNIGDIKNHLHNIIKSGKFEKSEGLS